jgi:hypothetical protein
VNAQNKPATLLYEGPGTGMKIRTLMKIALSSFVLILILAKTGYGQEGVNVEDLAYWIEDYRICDNRRNLGRIGPVAIGDINGDGYGDMIMGAPRATCQGSEDTGMVYVRLGLNYGVGTYEAHEDFYDLTSSPSITDPTVSRLNFIDQFGRPGGVQINGEVPGHLFGDAVASGDFNGDGVDDLAITASERLGPTGPGRVYLIRGRSGIQGTLDPQQERLNSDSFYIAGREVGDQFGEVLVFGDIDLDGKDDLVIGSPYAGKGGEVDIFFGRDFVPFVLMPIDLVPPPHVVVLAERENDQLGTSVAIGDMNGDNRPDLVIGAPMNSEYATNSGKVYILYNNDLVTTGQMPVTQTIDLAERAPSVMVFNSIANDGAGSALAVGDCNGDGLQDLVIGAPYGSLLNVSHCGKVYFLYNKGQFTNNFYVNIQQSVDLTVSSTFINGHFGHHVAALDINDDGIADIIMTVPYGAPMARDYAGGAYIVMGRSGTNVLHGYAWVGDRHADVDIIGGERGDFVGYHLAIGDINGDAIDDFILTGDRVSGVNSTFGTMWALFGTIHYEYFNIITAASIVTAVDENVWQLYR